MQQSPTKFCPQCGRHYEAGDVCPTDGEALVARPVDPLIGQVIKGAYKVRARIARGGMGVVYRATQISLGRPVAVKVLRPEAEPDADEIRRFFREARLLSQINHPNVVNLLEFGTTESGLIYMVMELLTGRTLEEAVPPDRGLDLPEALAVMEQVCAGVGAAHGLGIVHRDLKPSNVILAEQAGGGSAVKVLDFGIAKLSGDREARLTRTGAVMGSCGYMSPEQIEGAADIGPATDVYALGALFYFVLAGRAAYEGRYIPAVITRQLSAPPPAIDFAALGKPEAAPLMDVIQKAMKPRPELRHPGPRELMEAARRALGRADTQFSASLPSFGAVAAATRVSAPTDTPVATIARGTPRPPGRRRRILLGAGVIALIAALLVLWVALDRDPDAGSATQGVSNTEVVLGMSGPFTGPSRDVGRALKVGLEAGFREVNDSGGVAGRKIRLVALDDGYEPGRALEALRTLDEQHRVFGIVGSMGTPTAEATLPHARERGLLFFGAYSGADLLRRQPPDRCVFNLRASYAEEAAAIVRHLVEVRKVPPAQIAVFAQQDSYGDSGFAGVASALGEYGHPTEKIVRVGYARNTAEVRGAADEILRRPEIRALVLVASYRPAARMVQALRDAKREMILAGVSFLASEALAEELRLLGPRYFEGLLVSQVVPPPDADLPAVVGYRATLRKYFPDETPGYTSLEGYLDARLLAEGLRRTGRPLSTDALIAALETIREYDLGIGVPVTFGPTEHQASHRVWLTVLDQQGRFSPAARP